MVIVDTGSADSTVDIARSYAARLLHFAWRDDFAAARNFGLDAACGDWILYIDADERLTAPVGGLRERLDESNAVAARLLFYPRLESTPYRELRLFRNLPELRFSGAMHETMVPAVDALATRLGMRVIECDAIIRHFGYEGDLAAKHAPTCPCFALPSRATRTGCTTGIISRRRWRRWVGPRRRSRSAGRGSRSPDGGRAMPGATALRRCSGSPVRPFSAPRTATVWRR